jgi:glycosyltransferase involved in cell wall biosynthesis
MPEAGSQGGPAACEPPFVAELRRLGHEVVEEIYAFGGGPANLAGRVRRVRATAQRFEDRVRTGAFDLVHINTSFDTKALLRDAVIVPRIANRGARVFLKFHGSDARLLKTRNPALAGLRNRLLQSASGIGLLSTEEQGNFLRAGVQPAKACVIKNVVEPNPGLKDAEFLKRWALPDDRPLLLFIGRFIEAKGLLDVIEAASLLHNRGREFLLCCLGDGPTGPAARALVQRLKLENHARFFGYLPEAETSGFYANSTLLLFPTWHYEGFPMVIFNAAAAGLPIITTKIRAAADYLSEPDNCRWVEPKQPIQLAETIQRLLVDSSAREKMALNNRKLAESFSAELVTREYVECYQRMFDTK